MRSGVKQLNGCNLWGVVSNNYFILWM